MDSTGYSVDSTGYSVDSKGLKERRQVSSGTAKTDLRADTETGLSLDRKYFGKEDCLYCDDMPTSLNIYFQNWTVLTSHNGHYYAVF